MSSMCEASLTAEIAAVFPKWNSALASFGPEILTDDELRVLRESIWNVSKADLPAHLGLALGGMLKRHPIELSSDASYDMFIQFLNAWTVPGRTGSVDIAFSRNFGVFAGDNDIDIVKTKHAEIFDKVDSKQAGVICRWLSIAKRWEASQFLDKDIESALLFWGGRIENLKGAGEE